jgi:membrane protein required for colicin V production
VSPIDVAACAVLAVALVRGLAIGMVREAFSVAALAAACLAVRFGTGPAAAWLLDNALPGLGPLGAEILAGTAVGLGAALAVGLVGRLVRRGVHAAGLGLADRVAGAAIGAAEGALLVGIALLLAILLVGRGHPLLARSRTLATFERAERLARGELASDVAAPPPTRRR